MNKRKSLILLPILLVSTMFGVLKTAQEETLNISATNQTINNLDFVTVENFLYSGKGLLLEFTFDIPSSTKKNEYSLLTSDWKRLTTVQTMTFYPNGSVDSSVGKVFKYGSSYYFQLMFSDLSTHLNKTTGEVASGNETIGMMFFNSANVTLTIESAKVINSYINVAEDASIRDASKPGLKFKAYLPTIDKEHTYGMIIVPNHYVAGLDDDYIEELKKADLMYVDLKCEPSVLSSSDSIYKQFGNGYFIQGSLTNIKLDNYQVPFTAIPYEKDTSGKYFYGNFIKEAKTTLYETCIKEKETNLYNSRKLSTQTYINNVISHCENHNVSYNTTNVKAYFVNNTVQVLKTDELPSNLCLHMELDAAQNESESFQLILNSQLNNSKRYYVNAEPLVNSDNNEIRIPARNITVSKQLYQNVQSNWSEHQYFGKQGYYHGQSELPKLGWFPDALLPFDLAIDAGENYLSNENGSNNGLTFKINIPKDTPTGTYTSKVIVRIIGEGEIVLPITLKVHNFEIIENLSKFNMMINTTELGYVYGKNDSVTSKNSRYYRAAYELMSDNGIGTMVPSDCWSLDQIPAWIEATKKAALDKRIASYFLPSLAQNVSCSMNVSYRKYTTKSATISLDNTLVLSAKDYKYSDSITLPGYETLFREMVLASTNECNLFKKAIVYFPQADEPGSNLSHQLQNILCQNVIIRSISYTLDTVDFTGKEEVRNSLADLGYIVTSYPKGIMHGYYVDSGTEYQISSYNSLTPISSNCSDCYIGSISDLRELTMIGYCPTYDSFEYFSGKGQIGYSEIMSMLGNDKYTMWWYGCCMPVSPFPVATLNAPYIRMRANKWLQYKLGVEGELYYMCNRGSSVAGNESDGATITPINNERAILDGACTYSGEYGDGLYIYPVHNLYKQYNEHMYFLASMRLNNLSESGNDYTYLKIAEALIEKLPANEQSAEISNLNSKINNIVGEFGPYDNTTDHELFAATRKNLLDYIDDLVSRVG